MVTGSWPQRHPVTRGYQVFVSFYGQRHALQEVRSLLPQLQIAFCNGTFVPFRYVRQRTASCRRLCPWRHEDRVYGMDNAIRRLDPGTHHPHFIHRYARGSIKRQIPAFDRFPFELLTGQLV